MKAFVTFLIGCSEFRFSVLLICTALAAPAQVAVDRWTIENGLPQNIVRAICQTPDSYLWMATFDGLVRFDGVRFTTFNRSNTPGINGNRFGSLLCESSGDIWAGTEGSGVTLVHHGRFKTYTIRDGLRSDNINGVIGDNTGNVWVLSGGQINRWQGAEGRFTSSPDNKLRYSDSLTPDGRMGFWGVNDAGLHVFQDGVQSDYPFPVNWPAHMVSSAGTDPDHDLFLFSSSGWLAELTNGVWLTSFCDPLRRSACNPRRSFSSDYRDSHGNVWHVEVRWDAGYGLVREVILPKTAQPNRVAFNTLFEDREGSVWLTTDGQGVCRIRNQTITVYSEEQGLPGRNIYPMCQTKDGSIWIGTWDHGLSRLKEGKFTNYGIADGLAWNRIDAIFEDRNEVLWVAVEGNLHRFRNNRFETVDLPPALRQDLQVIRAIHQTADGAMWFGTSTGLFRELSHHWSVLTAKDGLATDDVRVIIDSASGGLWIAGYGGLSLLRNGHVQRWTTTDGLASNTIRALYEDPLGVLWIGTYDGGLCRLENGKFTRYTDKQGLYNNGAFRITEDSRGRLWMTCNRGIYRVDKKQLNDFAAGRINMIASVAYGVSDGMKNAECNGGLGLNGIKAHDGKLWFPTQDGVAVIDPEKLPANPAPPPVVIESFLIDGKPADLGREIKVMPGQDNIEIRYTALSFVNPERIRFRYRLEGIGKEWVEAETRRTTDYTHLPPGRYMFHVSAANSDGPWSTPGATVHFTVTAPFYRTWWFVVLWLAAAAVSLQLIWRYRLGQLRRAKDAQQAFSRQLIASQESERKRIAAELHDTIGQSLAIIKNLAMLALNKNGASSVERAYMEEILSEASQVISEVREISYNLRPYQLDRFGLTKSLETMLRNVAAASNIAFEVSLDDIDGAFIEQSEISFYRIVQEAVNNILNHSGAAQAQVTIRSLENKVILMIRDNGKGCSAPAEIRDPRSGGFGLLGISERAELLGGRLIFDSIPGQGTTVSIEFNLKQSTTEAP